MRRTEQGKSQPSLTEAQHDILNRVGECQGPELIRRVFLLAYPGKTYPWWAERLGFSHSLLKSVVSGHRTTGEKTEACMAALARDLGLPRRLLFEKMDQAA